ncbi:MAG TPA: sugar phosphate isomerase/epimerase [Alphaproteobacteria bacterium]|jgi:sugar phosphate isomerase/epimerase|nr:sugar phosphate isomerase/epimerase [Alphaproteobacteria bacterium]
MATLCFNTMNESTYLGCPLTLSEQIDAAAAAGFPLIGIDMFTLATWLDTGRSLGELADLLASRNMACWELAAAIDLGTEDDPIEAAGKAAEAAAVLKPQWVQGNIRLPLDRTALALFDRVSSIVNRAGPRVALEYLPWTPVNSIATARDYVDHVGLDRAGVMVDSWHHFRGPDTYSDLEALPLDHIAYVQFDDALPMASDDILHETVNRRTFPGDGEFDLSGFCSRLTGKGFDGVVSIEILNDGWRGGAPGEFAARAYRSSARYWRGAAS